MIEWTQRHVPGVNDGHSKTMLVTIFLHVVYKQERVDS